MMLMVSIAIVFLTVTFILSRKLNGFIKAVSTTLMVLMAIALYQFFSTTPIVRSPDQSWYEITPWKQITLIVGTLFGMIINYLLEYFQARIRAKESEKKQKMPKFIWEKIALPFIVAVLVFGYFWEQHGKEPISVSILLISFQNGFFWQTVLEKVKG